MTSITAVQGAFAAPMNSSMSPRDAATTQQPADRGLTLRNSIAGGLMFGVVGGLGTAFVSGFAGTGPLDSAMLGTRGLIAAGVLGGLAFGAIGVAIGRDVAHGSQNAQRH